jgi:uncharacterized phage protein (TIGR02218 family)
VKTIPVAMQAHLSGGATTLCYCWRVTRRDGLVQGFTDHDEDLFFSSTLFKAGSGFTAAQISKTLGLAVDNTEVKGALSSDTINEEALASGLYDDAYVELFLVNWTDVSQNIVEMTGYTGEAKRTGSAFQAELRGLTSRLNTVVHRQFQRSCDAVVGDTRCGVSLTGSFLGSGVVASVVGPRTLVVTGITAFDTKWFSQGVLTFTSGPNTGSKIDVKSHVKYGSIVTIDLWERPAYVPAVATTFSITAGCDLTIEMCNDKFNNITNNRSFPTMPGPDAVLKNVDPSASNKGTTSTTTRSSK